MVQGPGVAKECGVPLPNSLGSGTNLFAPTGKQVVTKHGHGVIACLSLELLTLQTLSYLNPQWIQQYKRKDCLAWPKTTNSNLLVKLQDQLKAQQCGMFMQSEHLLHYNALTHSAYTTTTLGTNFPPSCLFAQFGTFLFLEIKHPPQSQQFYTTDNVIQKCNNSGF